MNIIFQIDGGIGKSIMATAVCEAIKKQYPKDKLIVVTGYPEVFLCNPGIKVFTFSDMRYFYETYVEGQEVKMMAHNPYLACIIHEFSEPIYYQAFANYFAFALNSAWDWMLWSFAPQQVVGSRRTDNTTILV